MIFFMKRTFNFDDFFFKKNSFLFLINEYVFQIFLLKMKKEKENN